MNTTNKKIENNYDKLKKELQTNFEKHLITKYQLDSYAKDKAIIQSALSVVNALEHLHGKQKVPYSAMVDSLEAIFSTSNWVSINLKGGKSILDEKENKEILRAFSKSVINELENSNYLKLNTKQIKFRDFENFSRIEFEDFIKYMFNSLGYTVIQPPLSRNNRVDLIVTKDEIKTIVELKNIDKKESNKTLQQVIDAKKYYKADNAIVVSPHLFTKNNIDFALSNKIELWDGKKLKDLIKNLEKK